jgi:hypothetical protein
MGICWPLFVGVFSSKWGYARLRGLVLPIFNLVQGYSKLSKLMWRRVSLLYFDSLREGSPLRYFEEMI